MTLFIKALQRIRPNALYQSYGDDYNKLVWVDTIQTKPTEAEIIAAVQQIQLELVSDPTLFEREAAKKRLDDEQRFLIEALIKEFNILRKFTRDLKTEIQNATSLADLKLRVNGVNGLPVLDNRTIEQVKNLFDQEV